MIMDIDKNVMKFVDCTRCSTNSDELSESAQARLEILFDDCLCTIINKYNEEFLPALIICDTYNKYSTVLPIKLYQNSYKYYIVYDCHLSQINRLFDALYLDNNDSSHDVWKLSYELFAEDALLEGDKVLVSYYGLNKAALGPFIINDKEPSDLDFIMDIQERYIIGHELGHWIYKVSSDKNIESIFNINLDAEWPQFLENIKKILCDLYETFGKKFQTKEYTQIIHEQKQLVNENAEILEECFADAIAYAMTFSYVDSCYSHDLNQKLLAGKALFLEMMNLQLLAMQHMHVSEKSSEAGTSIRVGFLRNYARLYFEGNERLFDNMLEETIVRYEERITNIMLECFSVLESRGDNIYDALIDVDGMLDLSKTVGLGEVYQNSDLI